MPYRKRYLAWLLLVAGLLIAPWIGTGQPAPTGWAPTSPAEVPSASTKLVIASSKPLLPSAVTPFSVPDDGLVSPLHLKPIPSPVATANEVAPSPIQRAVFLSPASKSGEDAAISRVSDTARATSVSSQASSLSVEVQGPASVSPGETLQYEIIVTNPGVVLLAKVRLADQLPAGAKLRSADPAPEVQGDHLIWDLGNLEGRGQRRIRVEIQPGGQAELLLAPTATFTAALGLRTKIIQPPFAVTQSAPDVVQRGTPFSIQIQVANNGTAPLTRVVLQDQLPAGLEHPQGQAIVADVGTVAPGELKTLRLDVIATQTGRFVNEVTALADDGKQARSRTTVQVTETTLGVLIDAPYRMVAANDADVRIEVSNPGLTTANNVRLLQQVPEGFEVLSASTSGVYDPALRTVTWSLGTLPGGQRQIVALKVRPSVAGVGKWDARLNAERMAEARATHTIHVAGSVSLELRAVVSEPEVVIGGETIVEARALNQGTASGSKVRITVLVGEGLLMTSADGPSNGQQGQQVAVFDAVPTLAAHGIALYKVKLRGHRPGDWRVVVEMTADDLPQPLRQEMIVRVK